MPTKTITFRDSVSSQVVDFMEEEGRQCARSQSLLTYLIGALLNYKEESVEYRPLILFCDNIEACLQPFPGAEAYFIGELPLNSNSGKQFLKECAPLSSEEWNLYIERTNGDLMRYGIFSYYDLPTTVPIEEANSLNFASFSVLIRQKGKSVLELAGSKGNSLTVDFSTTKSLNFETPREKIELFAEDFCKVVPVDVKDSFTKYMSAMLEAALQASHGTILISLSDPDISSIAELTDAVALAPPLDFLRSFQDFISARSADSILGLQRAETLLKGLIGSDGIVVVNDIGCILAYRAFYRPDAKLDDGTKVVGGARRRAFEGVKTLVGKGLNSVLFRSQDGDTIYYGLENAR